MQSVIASVNPQRDGRRWVRELHTDDQGVEHVVTYMAELSDDLAAILAARAVSLTGELAAGEIAANIDAVTSLGSLAAVTLKYSTAAANGAALRAAYKGLTQVQAIMAGDYLSTLPDATLRGLFGMTAVQVTNLRTNKLTPAASAAATIRASAGA